eukprot:CAMPEP_0173287218 /NCGR_PEP_ID=MMETSP1143-20121109/9651_1 /TAXON_ID=483371 /ORGANISM="non described non described, Strain CCMP2298" /LENGTH=165 /DNA_ID=CAMNT_0014225671 /DNA_START=782 /DNA_END=1281 /DNA_ORIENTATION=-
MSLLSAGVPPGPPAHGAALGEPVEPDSVAQLLSPPQPAAPPRVAPPVPSAAAPPELPPPLPAPRRGVLPAGEEAAARAHEGRTSANARASAALHSAKSFKWRSAQPSSRDVPQPLPSRQARLCACERWAAARNKPMQSASLRRALADSAPLLTGDRLAKPRQVRR